MQLRTSQLEFMQVILNPELAQAYGKKWLHKFHGISAEERFSVYRSNIFGTLTKALTSVYPLCEKVIGENGFKQLAYQYIHYTFPTEACLYNYGGEMSEFIKTIPKLVNNIPYMSDLATYEWICHQATHAPVEKTVTNEDLELLNENKFSELPLKLTKSFGIIKSEYPLQTIIEYIKQNPEENLTYVKEKHYFLIYRFFGEVREEEISEIFYKGLLFLKMKKGKKATILTLIELSNFMLAKNHSEEVEPFIHFLFNRNLIQKI
jgi:hypothetical protein